MTTAIIKTTFTVPTKMKNQPEVPLDRDPDLRIISEELEFIIKSILGKEGSAPDRLSGYKRIADKLESDINTYLSHRAAKGLKAPKRTRRLVPKKNLTPVPVIRHPDLVCLEYILGMVIDCVLGWNYNIAVRPLRYERVKCYLECHINEYLKNWVPESMEQKTG